MKKFSCHIITLILLAGCISLFQASVYASTAEIEVNGQIGGNKTNPQPPKKHEQELDTKLAQPKQAHIELRKFPNTGSLIETIAPIGFVLLLIYLLLSRWKAHRKNYP
ncbi:hypothetical protein [Candidatus Enterococcus ikei]|uniref:Gram-positive cocci surface proteins LPxTG domain-containing protein n=1 Tax=Candidatus Enterococcus ikei TaxID=2815326 RepID=A0ABS3GUF3_9ENTE|nr:hypothetical protein [Enterococcus sp. DIV0869a]MBO0438790.1 hypothetical protein [Enterococcus sp. DIV0869a]